MTPCRGRLATQGQFGLDSRPPAAHLAELGWERMFTFFRDRRCVHRATPSERAETEVDAGGSHPGFGTSGPECSRAVVSPCQVDGKGEAAGRRVPARASEGRQRRPADGFEQRRSEHSSSRREPPRDPETLNRCGIAATGPGRQPSPDRTWHPSLGEAGARMQSIGSWRDRRLSVTRTELFWT